MTQLQMILLVLFVLVVLGVVILPLGAIGAYILLAFRGKGEDEIDANGNKTGRRIGDTYSTEIELDNFKILVKGKTPYKVLANLKDAFMNTKDRLVRLDEVDSLLPEDKEEKPTYRNPLNRWLRDKFGIWFTSILYDQVEIFHFELYDIHRFNEDYEGPLKNAVTTQAVKIVDRIYRNHTRYIHKVLKLKDGTTWDVVYAFEVETVLPIYFGAQLQGRGFQRFDVAVGGNLEDWANLQDLTSITTVDTGKGSDFDVKYVRNFADEVLESSGLLIRSGYIIELREEGETLAQAMHRRAIAKIEAEALDIEAKAKAQYIEDVTGAEANGFRKQLAAVSQVPGMTVSGDAAMAGITAVSSLRVLGDNKTLLAYSAPGGTSSHGIVLPGITPARPPMPAVQAPAPAGNTSKAKAQQTAPAGAASAATGQQAKSTAP